MLEKLRLVEERYMEMEERAAQPDFYADPKAATKLLKEPIAFFNACLTVACPFVKPFVLASNI